MADTIENMRKRLGTLVTDWRTDNSHPPNFIRETGMGDEVAIVDRWCGGYQDVHYPTMIGWRAKHGNRVATGFVMVESGTQSAVDSAILQAKSACSKALFELRGER
jgi:hypothetical protein